MDSTFDLIPRIINSGIAGILGVTFVFPFDLVKTVAQVQPSPSNGKFKYKSLLDVVVKTFRNEGFGGMYRAHVSGKQDIAVTFPMVAAMAASSNTLTLPREMLAGAGAGMCQRIISTPMELLKIQRQLVDITRVDQTTKRTARKIALQLLKEKGFFGLYQGIGATLLRNVSFSAINFPLFAHLNANGKRREGSNQAVFYHSFISGCIAGCTAAFLVTPFDVVKTRLQLLKYCKGKQIYKGIIDCFVKLMKHEGLKVFFKGGFNRVLVMASLYGIEQTVYFLGVAEFLLGYKKP